MWYHSYSDPSLCHLEWGGGKSVLTGNILS